MRVIWQAKNGSIWLRREGPRPVRKVLVSGTKVRKRTWMYALWWGWNKRVGFKQVGDLILQLIIGRLNWKLPRFASIMLINRTFSKNISG